MSHPTDVHAEFLRRYLTAEVRLKEEFEKHLQLVKEEVLLGLIKENAEYLPLYVVHETFVPNTDAGRITVMHYLGRNGHAWFTDGESFYQAERLVESPYENTSQLVRVRRLERRLSSSIGEIKGMLNLLRKNIYNGVLQQVVAPVGYFIFRYQTNWAAGGRQGEPKTEIRVIRADSVDIAIEEFKKKFRYHGFENCFRDFSVYVKDGWLRFEFSV